jgi:hypothetical protein
MPRTTGRAATWKGTWTTTWTVLATVALASCGADSPPTPTTIAGQGWEISFPNGVEDETEQSAGLTITFYSSDLDGDAYGVGETVLRHDVSVDLQAAVDGAVQAVNDRGDVTITDPVTSGPVTIDGVEGLEFSATGRSKKQNAVEIRGIVVVHEAKVLQVYTVDLRGDDAEATTAFRESFRLGV